MISLTLDLGPLHPAVPIAVAIALVLPWLARAVRPLVRMWMESLDQFDEVASR